MACCLEYKETNWLELLAKLSGKNTVPRSPFQRFCGGRLERDEMDTLSTHWLCTRRSLHRQCSFKLHNSTLREAWLSPFYRWGKRGLEIFNDVLKGHEADFVLKSMSGCPPNPATSCGQQCAAARIPPAFPGVCLCRLSSQCFSQRLLGSQHWSCASAHRLGIGNQYSFSSAWSLISSPTCCFPALVLAHCEEARASPGNRQGSVL